MNVKKIINIHKNPLLQLLLIPSEAHALWRILERYEHKVSEFLDGEDREFLMKLTKWVFGVLSKW